MRRIAALLLSLAACGTSAAARRAQSLYDRGDYDGAARAADADLASHPGDDALHRVAIRARLAGGDAHGAVLAYAAWRGGQPDDPIALRMLAETTFQQALRAPSNAIKVQAIEAVERFEIESLADDVIQRLGDQDDEVQAAAAVAVLHAHPQAPEILAQMMTSDDPVARVIAMRGLGEKLGSHAAEDLRAAIGRDPDPRVRITAIAGLAPVVDADTTAALQQAAHDPDDGVRTAALRALARPGRGDQRALGQAGLADPDVGVRIAAAELIVASGDAQMIEALLAHRDPLVAINGARAAAKADPAGAAAAFDRALADAAPETRAAALNLALPALGKEAATARAAVALADPAVAVRLAAARTIAAAGHPDRAIPVLVAVVTAPPPAPPPAPPAEAPSAPSPTDAMQPTDAPGAAPPAAPPTPAYTTVSLDDRIQAAADLARLGDARGGRFLSELAQTADSVARRREAVSAHTTARQITPGLVAALADPAPEVRVEAASALWSLARAGQLAAEHAE